MAKEKDEAIVAEEAPVAFTLAEPIDLNIFLPGGGVVEVRGGVANVPAATAAKLKELGY